MNFEPGWRWSILLSLIILSNFQNPCFGDNPPINLEELANAKGVHYARAVKYLQEKKYNLAKNEYSAIIKDEPNNARHYISRGSMELTLKEFAAAAADAERAANLTKFNGYLYSASLLHARASAGMNKPEEAIKWYREANERMPDRSQILLELGKLLYQTKQNDEKRNEEAIACLSRARTLLQEGKVTQEKTKLAKEAEQIIEKLQSTRKHQKNNKTTNKKTPTSKDVD